MNVPATNLVSISAVADINPRQPAELANDTQRLVSFVPMASVSEEGVLLGYDDRPYIDVLKGYTYFEKNDILLAKITPCFENGKAALCDSLRREFGFASTEFHVLRAKKTVHPRYLFYAIWNLRFRYFASANMTGSAGQKRVPVSIFDRYKIPLPPLPEQRRIAAILDKADAIRRKRRETIRLTENFLRSVFLDMFGDPVVNPKGWPMGTIHDLAESTQYGTSKKATTSGAFPYVRMGNITYEGGWDFSDMKFIDLTGGEESRYLVHRGEVLFNRTNSRDLVGKTAMFRESKPMAYAGYLVKLIPNALGDGEYIAAAMNSASIKTYLRAKCKNIIGMANINAREFGAIPLPLPPVDLQRRFAEMVSRTLAARQRLEYAAAETETLFAALTQQAFSGACNHV